MRQQFASPVVDYFINIILSIDKSIYRTTLVLYMCLVMNNIVFQAVIEVFSSLRKEPKSGLIKPRTLFSGRHLKFLGQTQKYLNNIILDIDEQTI